MRTFFTVAGLLLAITAFVIWLFFTVNYPSASLRYEITVEVEADGEVYSGSSVQEVTVGLMLNINGGGSRAWSSFKGEAVAVEIADRGILFVLLAGPRGLPNEPFEPEQVNISSPAQFMNIVFDVRGSSIEAVHAVPDRAIDDEVPFNLLPVMVRFEDINDPRSVTLVNPFDLASSFGEGVELRRVHVRTTQAPITEGIEERLTWLPSVSSSYLDGARGRRSHELTNKLHFGNFRTGFES